MGATDRRGSGRTVALAVLLCLSAGACSGDAAGEPEGIFAPPTLPASARDEAWRPQFHFTPASGWMNDPNGLVFHDGEYHLFFQHDPDQAFLIEVRWGHTVGTDLVHWTPLPLAIDTDPELGAPFSGSAVVVDAGVAGEVCGAGVTGCLVAALTHHGGVDRSEKQSLYTSADRGRTLTPYPGNPVLPNPGVVDFRDPKVFWHAASARWIMVLAAGDRVSLYGSADLARWTKLSEFVPPDTGGVLECPDLFALGARWVLQVDVNRGFDDAAPAALYWTGDFDGTRFVPDREAPYLVDGGADFYAAQSWSDTPDGRRVWIAWMSNWTYGLSVPPEVWRGAMSVPREVGLADGADGPVLTQRPVAELASLRAGTLARFTDRAIVPGENLLAGVRGTTLEIQLTVSPAAAAEVGLEVRVGDGEATVIGVRPGDGVLFVDRTRAGRADFSEHFARRHELPLPALDGPLDLTVLVDRSSVEVFAAGGRAVITDRVFPRLESDGVALYAVGGAARLERVEVHALRTIWPAD